MRYVIREKMFRLGEDSDITDEADRVVLHVRSPQEAVQPVHRSLHH